jgi:hypothetical protein
MANLESNVVSTVFKQKDENIVTNFSLYTPPTSSNPIEVSIDVFLEKPILKRMSDYKLTIARFRVPLFSSYPAFDLKNLFFQVTLRNKNVNYSQSLTVSNIIYSISEFVTTVNSLLSGAYNQTGLPSNTPPYIFYHDGTFCLVVPVQFITLGV